MHTQICHDGLVWGNIITVAVLGSRIPYLHTPRESECHLREIEATSQPQLRSLLAQNPVVHVNESEFFKWL